MSGFMTMCCVCIVAASSRPVHINRRGCKVGNDEENQRNQGKIDNNDEKNCRIRRKQVGPLLKNVLQYINMSLRGKNRKLRRRGAFQYLD